MQKDPDGHFFEKLRRLKNEADRVLFSDGGKHWPIFRIKVGYDFFKKVSCC